MKKKYLGYTGSLSGFHISFIHGSLPPSLHPSKFLTYHIKIYLDIITTAGKAWPSKQDMAAAAVALIIQVSAEAMMERPTNASMANARGASS